MLTRIELENFMSHAHTVIEPAAGLTVLIGPNNVGKSAIACALQILCYNETANYVLRHGEKTCSVTVETDDGHIIKWQRKKSVSYEIDGQKFDRLGRGNVPEELHEVLRLPKVDDDGKEKFDVHFGSQKSPIFLLNSSGAAAASFFASSSDAIRLVQMQQRHKDRIREAKKERSRLEKLSTKVNRELEALDPIVDMEPRITELEKLYNSIKQNEQRATELERDENVLSEALKTAAFHQAEADGLQGLAKPPEMHDTAAISRKIADIAHESERHQFAEAEAQTLNGLQPLPELADVKSLANLIRECKTVEAQASENALLAARLEKLSEPPAIDDVGRLKGILNEIERSRDDIARWEREFALVSDLQTLDVDDLKPLERFLPVMEQALDEVCHCERAALVTAHLTEQPELSVTEPLAELLGDIEAEQKTVSNLRATLADYSGELEKVVAEMRMAAKEEACPVCGGPIDVDRLLAQSALKEEA